MWMRSVTARVGAVDTILDLGCGTGRFSEALAGACNAQVVGLDPSRQMLARACAKRQDPRVDFALGCGESIPLRAASVDVVFMSMVFHHFEDPFAVARECNRVLSDRGTVFVRSGTLERVHSYPYVPFFPASESILAQRLPPVSGIRAPFEAAGFAAPTLDVVIQEIAPDLLVYSDRIAVGADSVLASLTSEEFEAGLAALRAHAAVASPGPVTEPIDLFVFSKTPEVPR